MLYFAYGSNMWMDQMLGRCPGSRFIGRGVLHGYRWQINERGYANIVKYSEAKAGGKTKADGDKTATGDGAALHTPIPCVHGLLYELDKEGDDEALLDLYEGVRSGAYSKVLLDMDLYPTMGPDFTTIGDAMVLRYMRKKLDKHGTERLKKAEGVLVYLSENFVTPGTPQPEYVRRMLAGLSDAYGLYVPMDYFASDVLPQLEADKDKAAELLAEAKSRIDDA